jgi:hypothetical protein
METPTKFYLMNGPLYADDLQFGSLVDLTEIKKI